MKKVTILVCTIITLCSQVQAQKRIDNIFFCGYGSNHNAKELCNYLQKNSMITDKGAENAVDKILAPLGLPRNFVLVTCPNIQNAVAVTPSDGIRYIVYDLEFMRSIDRTTTDWSSASILAHEIGHHLSGHTLVGATDLADSRRMELEADEFSGFVLSKMGASLKQAQAAIINICNDNDDSYSTHPKLSKRLDAVSKGFAKAQLQNPSVADDNITDVELYYAKGIQAYESKDFGKATENLLKAIKLNTSKKNLAYYYLGSIYDEQKRFQEADNMYATISINNPTYANAYLWRARSNANLDPETTLGLAKPYYEKYIELASADKVKYKNDLIEANYYLAYHYYLKKEKSKSLIYLREVKDLDPNNQQGKALSDVVSKLEVN